MITDSLKGKKVTVFLSSGKYWRGEFAENGYYQIKLQNATCFSPSGENIQFAKEVMIAHWHIEAAAQTDQE